MGGLSVFTNDSIDIVVQPQEVFALKINREHERQFFHELCRLAIMEQEVSFFSWTEDQTSDYLSLIVDEDAMLNLSSVAQSSDMIEVGESPWRMIELYLGPTGLGTAGFICTVSSAMSAAGISLLNVSTFSSDTILVRSDDIDIAIETLKQISTDLERRQQNALCPQQMSLKLVDDFPLADVKVEALPNKILLATIKRDQMQEVMYELMQTIFYPPGLTSERFLSYTVTNDEISLFFDESTAELFKGSSSMVLDTSIWRALKLNVKESIGFDQTGIVSAMSTPLSKEGITMLNVSTFDTDITLVYEDNAARALEILNKYNRS
eukprot:GFYU01001718.1.p1 GENE.GFYU01001718.1~~GFYU01001718.1.p1  ORF type:complete len:322 (-),score=59.87 GFYU01001718.1:114-1079(-)